MTSQGGTIYSTTLQVLNGDTLYYRFVNGENQDDMEEVPMDCGWLYNGTDYARYIVSGQDTLVEAVCYATCHPCDIGIDDPNAGQFIGRPFPNPANRSFKVPVWALENAELTIYLQSLSGIVMKSESFHMSAGYHEIELDTRSYAGGLYLVNMVLSGQQNTIQLSDKLVIIN